MSLRQLYTRTWEDNGSRIEEHQYTTESAASISKEMDTLIHYLYQLGGLTEVAQIASIDQIRSIFPKILFHRIDVHNENPVNYKVLDYDRRTRMDNFQDYTGLVLGQWENEIARQAITLAYYSTVVTGLPRLALTTKVGTNDTRSYLHLTWPLRENGEITQVLVAASYENLVVTPGEGDTIIKPGPNKISLPTVGRGRKILSAIEAQSKMTMPIYPRREPASNEISQIMTDCIVNPLINGQEGYHAR